MATTATRDQAEWTLADLYHRFGAIPFLRIRQHPAPGTATVEDVIQIHVREDRLCELVDGILVEKAMGYYESVIACLIIRILVEFVESHKLGIVAGEAGMMQLAPDLVRIPDVSFISWDRLPNQRVPRDPIPHLAPDLAVEVLSKSNSKREMDEKLDDYFASGVRLVWFVDPEKKTVRVYLSRHESRLLGETETLDGGDVLPGLTLPIREIFATPIEEEAKPEPQKPT